MLANSLPVLDQILDRYFLSQQEMGEAKTIIQTLGVEKGVEQIASVLKLSPRENKQDIPRLNDLDVSGFAFDLAQSLIPKINALQDVGLRNQASRQLGQIVQYSGLDIWESIKDHKPDFISEFLIGFRRFKAQHKLDNKEFFQNMGVGYFHDLEKKRNKQAKNNKTKGIVTPPILPVSPKPKDHRRIDFNKHHDWGRRQERFCKLLAEQYGYVNSLSNIRGFFSAEYQFGTQVRCKGSKRNHIALLFSQLVAEGILVSPSNAHWKVMENCFVDEEGNSLSKSFSKLLSKLKSDRDTKSDIFDEVDAFIHDFKK